MPHGLTIRRAGEEVDTWLGSVFSDYPVFTGDQFARPTAGGGGFGDPLERDPLHVLEDVIDDYVSIERAKVDYGVVLKVIDRDLCEYEIDLPATEAARTEIRDNRKQWARSDPAMVSARYKSGEIDAMDAVRRFAVILDWESGNVLENTTRQFRESFERRSVAHWK